MPKYKVGEIIKGDINGDRKERKVLGICGEVYFISRPYEFDKAGGFLTQTELDDIGYTLAQPAQWVPEYKEEYCYVNTTGHTSYDKWCSSEGDKFRLSIGNVFQVGDYAGIEALKRKWQEGVNS